VVDGLGVPHSLVEMEELDPGAKCAFGGDVVPVVVVVAAVVAVPAKARETEEDPPPWLPHSMKAVSESSWGGMGAGVAVVEGSLAGGEGGG